MAPRKGERLTLEAGRVFRIPSSWVHALMSQDIVDTCVELASHYSRGDALRAQMRLRLIQTALMTLLNCFTTSGVISSSGCESFA